MHNESINHDRKKSECSRKSISTRDAKREQKNLCETLFRRLCKINKKKKKFIFHTIHEYVHKIK